MKASSDHEELLLATFDIHASSNSSSVHPGTKLLHSMLLVREENRRCQCKGSTYQVCDCFRQQSRGG